MTNSIEQVSAAFGIVMVFLHRRLLRFSGARRVLAGVVMSTVFSDSPSISRSHNA
jgi:hypothetical protein